jgi:hypothetical protein
MRTSTKVLIIIAYTATATVIAIEINRSNQESTKTNKAMHKSQIEMMLRDFHHQVSELEGASSINDIVSKKADEILKLAYKELIGSPGPTTGMRTELDPSGGKVVPIEDSLTNAKILNFEDVLMLIATRQTSRIRMNARIEGEIFTAQPILNLRVAVDTTGALIEWATDKTERFGEHELHINIEDEDKPIDFLKDQYADHTYQLYVEKLEFKVE